MNPQPFSKVEIGDAAKIKGSEMANRHGDWLQPLHCTLDRRITNAVTNKGTRVHMAEQSEIRTVDGFSGTCNCQPRISLIRTRRRQAPALGHGWSRSFSELPW